MRQNKYNAIYNDITGKIQRGEIEPNTKLPSEHDLAKNYDTSRETIRKALNLLSLNGYIQKVKGKGSIVLDLRKLQFPVSELVSFKEIAQKMEGRLATHVHEVVLSEPNLYIQDHLNISSTEKVWEVVRVREINEEKIILDKDYFIQKIVPTLTKQICKNSIYEYLEKELNYKISFAKKEITVEEATEEDKHHLDLNGDRHIVVVKNYVYLDDAKLFQYTESRHRMDKFKFVDFARRGQ
ncbi:trehalose operon repressor [Bacillus sp. SCS-151]|uniref:trehalose operon repressor n=1 Tax=Nanhaiella sioensis TaxID=3115293 RepID=UPI00397C40B1